MEYIKQKGFMQKCVYAIETEKLNNNSDKNDIYKMLLEWVRRFCVRSFCTHKHMTISEWDSLSSTTVNVRSQKTDSLFLVSFI